MPDADLIPSLMAASDVLGTGWFAAVAAEAGPGKTVAVVGDGAVGLLGVLAAKQLGAERIIAFSRHADRQALAREFGATDIVEERGDEGVARVKELTGGLGAHSVIEAVGTQESMMQAIRSTRPGGHVGFVGVSHDVAIPGEELFFAGVHLHGGPAPVRAVPAGADPAHLGPQDRPRQGLRPHPAPRPGRRGLPGDGRADRHQGPAHRLRAPSSPITRTTLGAVCARRRLWRGLSEQRRGGGAAGHDHRQAATSPTAPTRQQPSQEDQMKIQITIGDQRFGATLAESAAPATWPRSCRTIDMTDHGGVEKTGPLPSPLSLDGQPEGADPDVGTSATTPPATTSSSTTATSRTSPGSSSSGGWRAGTPAHRRTPGPVTATVEAR